MKKSGIVAVPFFLLVLLSAGFANAQADQQKDFYNDCISRKIAQCETRATLIDSRSPSLRDYAEVNRDQAEFYRVNQEQLVEEMVDANLTGKPHTVEHFLIKAYLDEQRYNLYTSK